MGWYIERHGITGTKRKIGYMMQGSLAERLRILRAREGLTLTEASERIGITRHTLSSLERGGQEPHYPTLAKIAKGYGVPVEELLGEPVPLGEAPREAGPPEKSEEERRLGYLRSWRAFVYKLVHRWEQDPPESSREIAVVLVAMQALLEEGAFERPPEQITTSDKREVSEWLDLKLLFQGIDRLNQMADSVQQMPDAVQEMVDDARADAEAERRRAAFREIKGQMAG
jgi:transcriptional regulator with XRE-family HTH domain